MAQITKPLPAGDRLVQLTGVEDTCDPQRSPEGSTSQRRLETARNGMQVRSPAGQCAARIRPEDKSID